MNENKISIKRYEQAADPRVSLGGIRWEKKWDVCVQCDSREEAEALRTELATCERCGEVNPAEIHTCTPKENNGQ